MLYISIGSPYIFIEEYCPPSSLTKEWTASLFD